MARRGFGGGGGAKGAHLKSMGSYEMHAWRDAMSIAYLLDESVGVAKARRIYGRVRTTEIRKYEATMESELADFIGRSESQRPSVVRKLPDEVSEVCFLTLAILGCVRAMKLMEVRDRYRENLAPGRGNRETTRALYEFSGAVLDSFKYGWPWEVFEAAGIHEDHGDTDDEEGQGESAGDLLPAELKPTLPPPPTPAEPVTTTQVAVTIGSSETVLAAAGSDKKAWKLQVVAEHSSTVALWLAGQPPNHECVVHTLVNLAGIKWGAKPTLLLLPESQQQLIEEINTVANARVAGVSRKGVSSMAFMKWPEEMLRALRRELELVGEAM